MKNPYLDQARKIVAQANAKANVARLSLARKRCYQLAMAACFLAGLGYIGFGIQLLFVGSQTTLFVFGLITALSIVVAWTAALCMSFSARPSLGLTQ